MFTWGKTADAPSVENFAERLSNTESRRIRIIGREYVAANDNGSFSPDGTVYFSLDKNKNKKESNNTLFDAIQETFKIIDNRWPDPEDDDLYLRNALYLSFIDCDFTHLPSNLGRILADVQHCTFTNCPHLSSLESTVSQFTNLTVLVCRNCPSITSLSSLRSIHASSTLYNIAFKNCGIRVTPDDDWKEGLVALGRTEFQMCILTIQECHNLTCLPPTIRHLHKKQLTINLLSNDSLWQLPPMLLGEMFRLGNISLRKCPRIKNIPWSIGRLPLCSLSFVSCPDLFQEFYKAGVAVKSDKILVSGNVHDFKLYFQAQRRRFFFQIVLLKIMLRRAGKRAIDRLYRPGGAGYERSKERFELMTLENQPVYHSRCELDSSQR
eukprot:scaffold2719_cov266-Chaetoceros_neogracile.AAC.12